MIINQTVRGSYSITNEKGNLPICKREKREGFESMNRVT
jgi:hypothetical protein